MDNLSVQEKIKAAAAAKGIPTDLALQIAGAESSYTTSAKNPRSTAGGLFQVVDDTWKRYGGAPGKKYDVDENIRVGTDIIADNMGRMRKVLNREPSYSEVYAAHFFGPTGAKAVISSTPDTPSNKVFSAKVLSDNPNLQNKTTSEIMTMLDRKMDPRAKSFPPAAEFSAPGRPNPMLLTQNTQSLPNVSRETMLAALGPNYQAAMALSYLSSNTDEDDSDLDATKARIAADKESARSPGMEWLMEERRPSPFASLDLTASAPFAEPVARMKKGGEVDKDKGDEDKSFFEEKSAKQRLDEMQNPPDKGPYVGSELMPSPSRLQLQGEIANDTYGGAGGFGRATYTHPISSEAALRAYIEGGGYKPKDRDYKGQVNNMGVSYNIGFSDGGAVSKKKITPLSERFDLGEAGEFDPIGNAKKTLQGAWETAKKVPGNLQALVTDPVAYAKSLPEPSASQLLNALGPSNVGGPLVAGIMMGPKSRTWNQKSFEDAVQLAGSKGNLMPPEEVWKRTGNIPNPPDYVPHQEINDSKSRFRLIPPDKLKTEKDHAVRVVDWIDRQLSSKDSGNMPIDRRQDLLNMRTSFADKVTGLSRDPYTEGMPAKYMFEHPELYAAYPQLGDTNIRLYRGDNGFPGAETAGAYWDRNNNAVNINANMINNLKYSRFDPRAAALHEMQHAVQDIEGMSQGTNPNMYKYDMDNFLKFYEKRIDDPKLTQQKATELAKDDWYRAHQGEAEARQATDRADMTDAERRSTFPAYDVPPDTLLSPQNPNWEFVGNMSHGGVVHRADGSPPEGEKPQVDNAASAKAAAMLRGFGDSAYSLAGGPVDLATMAMRLAGYKAEKPILGSDWIKQKAEEYGIRPADETDPQLNRLRQGSEFVSSFVNPAVPVRAAAAATTKSAEMLKDVAKSEAAYNLTQRAMASPAMGAGMAGPMYIVRQPGGEFPSSRALPSGGKPSEFESNLDRQLKERIKDVQNLADRYPTLKERTDAVANFFDTKMRDWYTKQASSVSDPVREALITGKIKLPKGSPSEEQFPTALVNAAREGDVTAMRVLEKQYDEMLGIKGYRIEPPGMPYSARAAMEQEYRNNIFMSMKNNPSTIPGSLLLRLTKQDVSKLSSKEAQQKIDIIRAKLAENPNLFNTIFEPKMERLFTPESYNSPRLNSAADLTDPEKAHLNPATNPRAASQPIYDTEGSYPTSIFGLSRRDLQSAAVQIDPKELAGMGVTEFLAKTMQIHASADEAKNAAKAVNRAIEAKRPIPTSAAMYGTKELLPKDSMNYQWREVVDPQAARIQAAMMDNSIAGYADVGTYGSVNGGLNALKNGDIRLFSLYGPEGHAVSNVEFVTPAYKAEKNSSHKPNTIPQFTGNGLGTKNAHPENYGPQIVDLINFIKPDRVDTRATSVLEKTGLIYALDPDVLKTQFPNRPIVLNPAAGRATGGMIERQPDDNRRYL